MQTRVRELLTERQQRELDYHREHARQHRALLNSPFSWEVLEAPEVRWWNAYWRMFVHLKRFDVRGKHVLVVGCGFGDDAIRLAKLGAVVSAFDLSPDSLEIGRALAKRESLTVDFEQMAAEALRYGDSTFDLVVARDILHHVDIPTTLDEIARVAKPGATFIGNEVYSHSVTEKIRRSNLVETTLYPRMTGLIYGGETPYITEDERKLSEHELKEVTRRLGPSLFEEHFNFLVNRIIPERFNLLIKADRVVLRMLGPLGRLVAGRVLFGVRIDKQSIGAPP